MSFINQKTLNAVVSFEFENLTVDEKHVLTDAGMDMEWEDEKGCSYWTYAVLCHKDEELAKEIVNGYY